jgi:branched-chain amino acid transport system substrate-binding protein
MEVTMKSKSLLFFVGIVVAFSLILALGCGKAQEEEKIIKIGSILPLTGDAAKYGENTRRGIDVAIEEIKKDANFKGYNFVVDYQDNRAEPKDALSIFQKMTTVDNIKFFLGPLTSSDVLAVAPVANKKKVIILAPAASTPQITNAGDYIFRSVMSDLYDGMAVASFAFHNLGKRSAGIIYINNDFGLGLKNSFEDFFKKYGGEVKVAESFNAEDTDFRTQLTKIKEYSPEAVFIAGQSQMGYILRQAVELGIETQFLSFSMFEDPKILEIAGGAAEGVYYTFRVFDIASGDEIVKKFSENYRNKYGQEPDIFAGLAYDAARILVNAIKNGGDDVEKVKVALYNTKDFPGVVGKTTFDANGDVMKPIGIKKVENGKFVWFDRNFEVK